MKVDRILYQKIFPTGTMYLNHKIGVEIQLDDGDDENFAFKTAKRIVDKWNLESNPSYAMTMEYMKASESVEVPQAPIQKITFTEYEPIPIDEKVEGMKQLLSLCTTKQLLERQRMQVERLANKELTELFENKLKEFQVLTELNK